MSKDKVQENWMLAKHKCDDCATPIVMLSKFKTLEVWLYQCSRCKTVWQRNIDHL